MSENQVVSDGTVWGSPEWYAARWADVPEVTKQRIVAHLRASIPADQLQQIGRRDAEGNLPAGWHFAGGMSVRNLLRQAVRDEELPLAPYPGGQSHRNWDDFYVQALEAAAGPFRRQRTPPCDVPPQPRAAWPIVRLLRRILS